MDELIQSERRDRIAILTLNRPESRNALSPDLIEVLLRHFREAEQDAQVKCILLRGAGECFSAGGDVKSFEATLELPAAERYALFEQRLLNAVRLPNLLLNSPKPVVVQAHGAVAGAGLALCLAADYVVSADNCQFIAAHVHVGLSVDAGISAMLNAAMGIKQAKRLALLGERIDAQQARELGIVTEVVNDDALQQTVDKVTARLAAGPAVAMAGSKALLNRMAYPDLDRQLVEEARAIARCTASDDFAKGIRAALQRKPATFD